MMGDDTPDQSSVWAVPAETQHATYRGITHGMLAARGITPAQACQVGCPICGVIDASPARCEQCAPPLGRPFTGRAPGMLQDDDRGLSQWLASTPEAMRCARDAAAVAGTHRPAASPTVGWCGLCPAGNRETCRCGVDGCADSSCPGRCRGHIAPETTDTEGGE